MTANHYALGGLTNSPFDFTCGFLGRLRAALGQVANFFGNDGKPHACFPCASGFDCGIQGENIGLKGDFINGLDDFGDVVTGNFDRGHSRIHGAYIADTFIRCRAGLFGQVVGLSHAGHFLQ